MGQQNKSNRGTVLFSSKSASFCSKCGESFAKCTCNKTTVHRAKSDGIVRIKRETKGRKGKGVSVIEGLPLTPKDLEDLCKTLKKKCGTGGTVKDDKIEIQGDHRETLAKLLTDLGYTTKIAGA